MSYQEPSFRFSRDFEMMLPRKEKAIPIPMSDWDYLKKKKVGSIQSSVPLFHTIGSVLLGGAFAALIGALTIPGKSSICWVIFIAAIICGTLSMYFAREQRKVVSASKQDVLDEMERLERIYMPLEHGIVEKAEDLSEKSILFFDRFDTFTDWEQYEGGKVMRSADFAHKGNFSLKKDSNNDPNGGYKMFPRTTSLNLLFSGWVYRPSKSTGGQGDRLAIEDNGFNGYGFAIDHAGKFVEIERRDSGRPRSISHKIKFNPPKDNWYQFQFHLRVGGKFELCLNDSTGKTLATVLATDPKYDSFDRVAVHGGFSYYVDELKVEVL